VSEGIKGVTVFDKSLNNVTIFLHCMDTNYHF